jgi:hypothetical protein
MSRALGGRLGQLRERYSDPLLTLLTVLLLILLFVVAPLQASGIIAFQAFGVAVGLIMIAAVLVLSGSLIASMTVLVALCMNVVVIVLRLRNQPTALDLHLIASAWLLMSVTLGWVVARAVFGAGAVNYHRVIGAVLLYLLIALTFVALFVFVGLLDPKAFSGIVFEDTPALASNLIYFSFVTLTTVVYGDIVPVHPVARSLCNLESISGQLFPATLLARLVTLELEQRR